MTELIALTALLAYLAIAALLVTVAWLEAPVRVDATPDTSRGLAPLDAYDR